MVCCCCRKFWCYYCGGGPFNNYSECHIHITQNIHQVNPPDFHPERSSEDELADFYNKYPQLKPNNLIH